FFLRISKAFSFLFILSVDTETNSKSRSRYILLMLTSSGNSIMHGPHHVAQKFTKRSFFESFFIKSPASAKLISFKLTGSLAHSSNCFFAHSPFHDHLTEQPNVFVLSTGTSLPLTNASSAFTKSVVFGSTYGFSVSSILPLYLNTLSLSKTKTWGVAKGPYAKDAFWVSPSYK